MSESDLFHCQHKYIKQGTVQVEKHLSTLTKIVKNRKLIQGFVGLTMDSSKPLQYLSSLLRSWEKAILLFLETL